MHKIEIVRCTEVNKHFLSLRGHKLLCSLQSLLNEGLISVKRLVKVSCNFFPIQDQGPSEIYGPQIKNIHEDSDDSVLQLWSSVSGCLPFVVSKTTRCLRSCSYPKAKEWGRPNLLWQI